MVTTTIKKQTIGIALGGGGAKGFAHIGVLKALSEAGIEIDVVTGTSIGALVGAAYAAGALDALERQARSIGLTDLPRLLTPTLSLKGFFSGTNVIELLMDIIKCDRIEELPRRYAAVSTDLETGEMVTHITGALKTAIRASISIPGIFTPVIREGHTLVDGGTVEPLPVAAARALGAELVLAVDLFGHPDSKERLKQESLFQSSNVIQILERSLAVSQAQLTLLRLKECPADLVIAPKVSEVGLLDFNRGVPLIEVGYTTAEAALPAIQQLLSCSKTDG